MRSAVTLGFWLFVACVASIAVSKTVLSDTLDPDLFWHLRVGEQLRAEGVHPIVDSISFASTRQPWTPYSWLAEFFMEWSWRTFGWRSAIVIEATAGAAIVVLIALCCLESAGRDRRMNCAIATAVGAFFAIPYLAFRPVTFAIVLLGCCAWLMLRDRRLEERSRAVWLVIPLTALCTNIHLVAVVMPIWIVCLFAGALWERKRRSIARYAALLVATSLACLATPMLPGAIHTGWHYLSSDVMVASGQIAELQRANLATLALAAIVLAVALGQRRRPLRAGEWLWLLATGVMMLRMGRFSPMFAFIAAPVLAATMPRLPDDVFRRRVIVAALAVALSASIIRLLAGFPYSTPMDQWINRRGPAYPVAAAAFVEENHRPRSGRIINEFNWGGYLAWRLGGKYQVFLDGRTQLYDEKFWRATYLASDSDAAAIIRESNADLAIIPIRKSRFRKALESLGWQSVRKDDVAEVLVPPTTPQRND
ncbi:MAG: hypothetical protein QOF78_3070 [Phycisphaerales bacterium]|jgi:hypothetical protein|nr:hypothetical protein [Phycisphaerales bacterium]